MKMTRILMAILLFGSLATAQKIPIPEFPDDLNEKIIPHTGLLQTRPKAIAVEYSLSAPYRFETDFPTKVTGEMQQEERFKLKYKIPVLLKDKVKVLLGHNFNRTVLTMAPQFKDSTLAGEISDVVLKGNRFTVYGSFNLTPNTTLNGAVSLSFNGNYNEFVNFHDQYKIFRTILMYRKEHDANNDWGVGIYYKKGFRSNTLLPFALWNKTFNDKWGFEAIFVTRFYMRYNYNKDNLFLAGYEYLSEDYSVNVDFQDIQTYYEFKWPKINFTGRWQHRFLPFLWTEVEGGLQYNWRPNTQIEAGEIPRYNIDILSNSVMFNVGFFIAPPDKWLAKG